jgi:hypothetical protein
MARSISRRTVLKGLGLAVGSAALGTSLPPAAEGLIVPPPTGRCYIYLDHAARNRGRWVVAALLVLDPRLPRQLLRRTKRARLSVEERTIAEITARQATGPFKQYLYRHLASAKGFIEIYGVHASRAILSLQGDQVGLFQLRMVTALLQACDLWRFREVFVYYNLPSLKGVSEKAFRTRLLQGVHLGTGTRLDAWEHAPVWRQYPGGTELLVDEGIQVADFAVYALYQKYQHGNSRWYTLIRKQVKREIPGLSLLRPLATGR